MATINGGSGNNSLIGDNDGNFNDLIFGGGGADTLRGGTGLDFIDYSDSNAAVSINLATGSLSGGFAAGDTRAGVDGSSDRYSTIRWWASTTPARLPRMPAPTSSTAALATTAFRAWAVVTASSVARTTTPSMGGLARTGFMAGLAGRVFRRR